MKVNCSKKTPLKNKQGLRAEGHLKTHWVGYYKKNNFRGIGPESCFFIYYSISIKAAIRVVN